MNSAVFGQFMENVTKYRDINLVTEKKETIWYQNQIIIPQRFSQKIYWLLKWKTTQTLMNKPIWDCQY